MKKHEWEITYYSNGCFLKKKYFYATDRADALRQLRESGEKVIEIYRCRKL